MRQLGVLFLILALAACAPAITPMKPRPTGPAPVAAPPHAERPRPEPSPAAAPARDVSEQAVRVGLATALRDAELSAVGGRWALYDQNGDHFIMTVRAGDTWTVDQRDGRLRVSSDRGATRSYHGTLVARPQEQNTVLTYNGKRYRGELLIVPFDSGLTVVNRLPIESYLRGVVPLEIGTDRTKAEVDAVRAQAVAARSYTYTRLDDQRVFDMTATVMDQVYGGMDAERPLSDEAIAETRDQVLMYHGRVINAPYHANSGGCTASASEVWRSGDVPYLVPVSDRIPGTDHYYCESSPKFRWTRTFDAAELRKLASTYLRRYGHAPAGSLGRVRGVQEMGRTPSGRVAALVFETDRGRFTVRGNDIRFVLRSPGGSILPSTMFTMEAQHDRSGAISTLVVEGTGAGHGVGMDQWGAIARARAGQDYLTILRTYYPGTTVGHIL
jgi:stage II sporulation protein D